MVIELFENEAPNTVANFISLVKKGYYDGLTFHRVLPGFMAQGGCPDGTGGGGPGYQIDCECILPNSRKHFRGSLSMAHAGPNTGGSQFFLCFAPAMGLDGPPSPNHHTVFGRVIEGLDQLAKIQRRDPQADSPAEPDKIIEMKVLRDRGHEYEPKTNPVRR
jgi:cyclophilin family peptidyl-prolyl cis-trans isomerase